MLRRWKASLLSSRPSLDIAGLCLLAIALSLLMLATALVFEHGFGYLPCVLCHYQRYVYLGIIGLAAFLLVLSPYLPAAAYLLLVLGFLGSAGLAGFHVGVEEKLWRGTDGCSAPALLDVRTVGELRELLLGTPVIPCDEVAWSLFGISMAGYNMILSVLFAAAFLWLGWPIIKGKTDARQKKPA